MGPPFSIWLIIQDMWGSTCHLQGEGSTFISHVNYVTWKIILIIFGNQFHNILHCCPEVCEKLKQRAGPISSHFYATQPTSVGNKVVRNVINSHVHMPCVSVSVFNWIKGLQSIVLLCFAAVWSCSYWWIKYCDSDLKAFFPS